MGEEQVFNIIGSLGFPIAVASYLMIKMDKTMQTLANTITEFAQTNREVLNELAKRRNGE